MKILAAAQDFGYGPIGMLNKAVLTLPIEDHVDYWVPRHLSHILDSRRESTVFDFDLKSLNREVNAGRYDAAILCCDYPFAAAIFDRLPRIVIYDMLFWFWPEVHPIVQEDILVIAQNFIGVENRADHHKSVQVVGPLLSTSDTSPAPNTKRSEILVNLGGFASPCHGKNEAIIYAQILQPLLELISSSGKTVEIAGGPLILNAVAKVAPKFRPHMRPMKHREFRYCMRQASLFLTVPGLGAIYESLFSQTPTHFLPPTNYTQAIQLDRMVEALPSSCFFCDLALWKQSEIGSEDSYISSLFKIYATNSKKQGDAVAKCVSAMLSSPEPCVRSEVDAGLKFIERMGGPGEKRAARYVREYFSSRYS